MTYRRYKSYHIKESKVLSLESFYLNNETSKGNYSNSERDSFEMSNPVHQETQKSIGTTTDEASSVQDKEVDKDSFQMINPAHEKSNEPFADSAV